MLCVSVSDLKLVDELSHMTEFEIVQIKNDSIVAKYAHECGIDTDFPVMYIANKHRNLRDQIVVGYRLCGEVRIDNEFRNSNRSSITDRLVMTSYTDPTLMVEVAELSFKVRDWEEHLNDNDSLDWDASRAELPDSQLEEGWQQEEKNIQAMNDMLVSIRGSCYNASGSLKSAEEYKKFDEERKAKNDN